MQDYNEILENMKDKYFEIRGSDPDEECDSGILLRLMAGEVYSLEAYADWLKAAMFVSSAHGEALDHHAAQRGLERKTGSKASGTVRVSVDVPLEYDVVIPQGTVFTTSDGQLYYESVSQASILSGTGSTFVEVNARYSGGRYNVAADTVTTVVTYFSSGISVTNSSAFTGGTDDETDEQLRERIVRSYRELSNGMNKAYYQKLAESINDVWSANVSDSQGSQMNVYVSGKGNNVSTSVLLQVRELLEKYRIPGITITVLNATPSYKNITVNIQVKNGYAVSEVTERVAQEIRGYFSEMRVGESFIAAELGARIISAEGVLNYSFTNLTDNTASDMTVFRAGTVTVNEVV